MPDQNAAPLAVSYRSTAFAVENNGHTIEAIPADLTADSVTVDGVVYFLQQFHFHASSEHLLNGAATPAELHLVHKSADGAVLVLGVLLNVGAENDALNELFSRIPSEAAESAPEPLEGPIDLTGIVPLSSPSVRYAGSLTTPPCTEGVQWNVFLEPSTVSAEQLSEFTKVYPDNHRPVQPLHDRKLTEVLAGAS
ncbi:carbonic anhydrase [Microbacterium resistens]|uniref:Carbonic anhydrase n=1 Tax=Microbacterium resistens TaxID=156977 RepID=A0ABU1SG07_9MICO|nr:carbonic anhydrase [Microbacterium resistens]